MINVTVSLINHPAAPSDLADSTIMLTHPHRGFVVLMTNRAGAKPMRQLWSVNCKKRLAVRMEDSYVLWLKHLKAENFLYDPRNVADAFRYAPNCLHRSDSAQ